VTLATSLYYKYLCPNSSWKDPH